jgi:hypothetical protein
MCVLSSCKLDTLGVSSELTDSIQQALRQHSVVAVAAAVASIGSALHREQPCLGKHILHCYYQPVSVTLAVFMCV